MLVRMRGAMELEMDSAARLKCVIPAMENSNTTAPMSGLHRLAPLETIEFCGGIGHSRSSCCDREIPPRFAREDPQWPFIGRFEENFRQSTLPLLHGFCGGEGRGEEVRLFNDSMTNA